jgi:beta-galactosidase
MSPVEGQVMQVPLGAVSPIRLLIVLLSALSVFSSPASAGPVGRERLSINEGWRFLKGEPAGSGSGLDYDVRPKVAQSADGKAADARPDEAAQVDRAGHQLLKPWILPTGNAFIRDPAKKYSRPAGNPGGEHPYVQASFDDRGWERVTLPHDWAIKGPFLQEGPYGGMGRLPSWGIGWYRRKLDIPASDAGKSIFLDIDGAMSYSAVWLNGQLVGGWPYGYNSFRLDLTAFVRPGKVNQLAIRLDNPPESARWYPGGGLYRDVWLVKTAPVHVGQWGVVVTTPEISPKTATVRVDVAVDNISGAPAAVDLLTEIYALTASGKRAGRPVASLPVPLLKVGPAGSATATASAAIVRPRLWGPPPMEPNLYVAVTTVRRGGKVLDRYETQFGIRTVAWKPNGLFVNGRHVRINGVNNHHDLGALGAAFNLRAAERQLEILREMGANAIRMSHNPPAPELLELTDRMGFLVIDEVFDSWERKKTPLDFHLIFPDWHEQDLRSMLRRDRNHPSIMLWSVGNEVGEQYTGEDGAAIGRRLVQMVREEDSTRLVTSAMNYAKADMPLPATVDVLNLNYQGHGIRTLPSQYRPFREHFPDKAILHSESASALSRRGEDLVPVPGVVSSAVRPGAGGDDKSQQVSAYELFASDFGSSPDKVFALDDQHPWNAGEFVWTGFDYLGEPTPYYGARSSYSGIVDLAGFPKDRFYLYQARWRPDLRFAHILPHWTWPGREGEVTPVHVFSSADEAELFVNGQSQGRLKRAPFAYRFRWDYVVYQPGEIKVVTYKDGKTWATASRRTVGPPTRLELTADRIRILADGKDLSFITARIVDADGQIAPRAKGLLRFSVTGAGEIVASDNGDPTSFIPFQSHERPAFNGLALVIVRARLNADGPITVRVDGDGIEPASIRLESSNLER